MFVKGAGEGEEGGGGEFEPSCEQTGRIAAVVCVSCSAEGDDDGRGRSGVLMVSSIHFYTES